MTRKEGKKLGLIALKDYIPSDELCIFCDKDTCDKHTVKGYMHSLCDKNNEQRSS